MSQHLEVSQWIAGLKQRAEQAEARAASLEAALTYERDRADALEAQLTASAKRSMAGTRRMQALELENAMLRAALEAAKTQHARVEDDPWFTCPVAWRGDNEGWTTTCFRCDGKPCDHGCNCTAEEHNAKIDAVLAAPAVASGSALLEAFDDAVDLLESLIGDVEADAEAAIVEVIIKCKALRKSPGDSPALLDRLRAADELIAARDVLDRWQDEHADVTPVEHDAAVLRLRAADAAYRELAMKGE